MILVALLTQPPSPAVPPATVPTATLCTRWESGRVAGGGVYAWFGVDAPPAAVYAVLADDAAMSGWIPHLARSTVLTVGTPCNLVDFAVPSPIGTVSYQLDRCRDGASVWWTAHPGDDATKSRFEVIEGSYQLTATPEGTLVRYWSHVVAALPVPQAVQDEIARIGVGDLVEGLRGRVRAARR